jgi:hypothetical protein
MDGVYPDVGEVIGVVISGSPVRIRPDIGVYDNLELMEVPAPLNDVLSDGEDEVGEECSVGVYFK